VGLQHPEASHDTGQSPFFEGWYVKSVSQDAKHRIALIPGIFRSDTGAIEAFVQVLDGANGRSWFIAFSGSNYVSSNIRFSVRVGVNHFDEQGFAVDLAADLETGFPGLRGVITYETPMDGWPKSVRSPGAMGWYAYVPKLECYHGVVSFGHRLSGALRFGSELMEFDAGKGYIEKDWGQAFPRGYVWMHSNTFSDPNTSLMGSLAVIPWLRGEFPGLLLGLRTELGLARFATYTGASVTSLTITDHEVELVVQDPASNQLELVAERNKGALLHAPIRTEMHKRVEETLDAKIGMRLTDKTGAVLREDVGLVGGLEVHGDVERLFKR
jgi:tocopherol cyclase